MTNTTSPPRDAEGFLLNPNTWTAALATQIAAEEWIELTADHWQIITFMREFYYQYQIAPSTRALLTAINARRKELNSVQPINTIYLHQLFPGGAVLQANKIAGLPKPVRCM